MEYYADAEVLHYASLPQSSNKKQRKHYKTRELCGIMPDGGDADRKHETYATKEARAEHIELPALPCAACQHASDTESNQSTRSKCSARELRNIVQNQCKLHDAIVGVLEALNKNEIKQAEQAAEIKQNYTTHATPAAKNLTEKKVTEQIEACHCLPQEFSNITAEDLVEAKLVNPLIRKFHNIYLENIQNELALIEELEHLPHKVNELYKRTVFKLTKND